MTHEHFDNGQKFPLKFHFKYLQKKILYLHLHVHMGGEGGGGGGEEEQEREEQLRTGKKICQ